MAFSCGFYNSLNGDRKYNARQVSELFDGIIRDGVYASIGDKLTVKQGTGMQIIVGTGRAWFNHSWSLVDAEYPLTVDQSDLILDRIDAVVLEVNESTEVRDNSIKMVKGTAASSPQKPTMTDTEFIHQYPLAYISVKKGVTEITTANIEINVGKDNCPYVTSILEAVSIEELYAQWEAQFKGWEEGQKTQFEEWFGEIKGQLSEDPAGNLQIQINDVKGRVDNEGIQIYTHSKSGTVHEFTGNGPNGRALMTDNVATGDTFTVNGTPVTAYMGTDDATDSMAGSAWNGKWVSFVYDGSTLNFKGGGGLSAADKETVRQWMVAGHSVQNGKVAGTIPSKAAATYTPKTTAQTIAAGQYLSGAQIINGDANLKPENIKAGVTIFGVTGKWPDNLYVFKANNLDPTSGGFSRLSGPGNQVTVGSVIAIPDTGKTNNSESWSGTNNLIDFSPYNTLIVKFNYKGNYPNDTHIFYSTGTTFTTSNDKRVVQGVGSKSYDISSVNTKNRILVRQYNYPNGARTNAIDITEILLVKNT